ncbi:MAG TPA: protein-L-isoaspartate(D-aspartate) O-methyltransferase [Allosphingosinicella sp.]|nr:protein-L-isoaspartate(D-aspartate) O-methyltransferase [Allosphingosinicella sp.]
MLDFAAARERMVERHIAGRGLTDPLLLAAFREVPRELFVGEGDSAAAYDDAPLPIPAEQTISQPYIVALMIHLARVRPGDRVLEVGAGSGYAAAVLSRIAGTVLAVERHAELAELATQRVARLGYGNVSIRHGDGSLGVPEEAPFDAIILSAAPAEVPPALPGQLRRGGALVMPLGAPNEVQRLVRIVRREEGGFDREELGAVRFVPLVAGEERR